MRRRDQVVLVQHLVALWTRLIERKSYLLELDYRRPSGTNLEKRARLARELERCRVRRSQAEERLRRLAQAPP